RGDGLYTATYTPATAGAVTITLTATTAGKTATRTVSGSASGAYTIVPGGPGVTVTTRAADENARLRFDGQAAQRISLKLSAVTVSSSYVSILKPDGSPLGSNVYVSIFGGFVDTRTLPVNGTYTILVDPLDAATGSITLTLYDVPPDVGGTITPGGPSIGVTTTTPGQNGRLRFDAQAGQRVSLKLSAGT